jgi:hypothetical protein
MLLSFTPKKNFTTEKKMNYPEESFGDLTSLVIQESRLVRTASMFQVNEMIASAVNLQSGTVFYQIPSGRDTNG